MTWLALLLLVGPPCADSADLSIWVTPRQPDLRHPVRIVVASERDPLAGLEIVVEDKAGVRIPTTALALGGPPYGWVGTLAPAGAAGLQVGAYRVRVLGREGELACEAFTVKRVAGGGGRRKVGVDATWDTRRRWDRAAENLYSLWIEHLFDAPRDQEPSWRPMHVAMRDRGRNLLHDYLGLGEDDAKSGLWLEPDCADFPYALRAYFSWKLGLPFAIRACRRGTTTRAPTCDDALTSQLHFAQKERRKDAFQWFARRKVHGLAHSSSARTAFDDDGTDVYPVRLDRHGVRPGTVYADPYGHILVVQRWLPGGKDAAGNDLPGVLYAVDSQPDGTVGRRRFWQGSFLFPRDGDVRGAGFKRFRPVRVRRRPEAQRLALETADVPPAEVLRFEVVAQRNAQIAASPDYGDLSAEQDQLTHAQFYERMDALVTPAKLLPEIAMAAVLEALWEEAKRRVKAVKNAEEWHAARRAAIPMPEGADIFQTTGGWEDYASPSRDMRLLIAIDAVRAFPARLTNAPQRFVLGAESPAAARARMEALLEKEAARRTLVYERSDGSSWTLTLADVMRRAPGFELAYNPNDCPELRWAAPAGSPEVATCTRRAPEAQTRTMLRYRPWFSSRRRPSG